MSKKPVKTAESRKAVEQPAAPQENEKKTLGTVDYLLKACEVCERGAAVAQLRSVTFSGGRLIAFNGIYQYQAPSGLDVGEAFAVSEDRLASALRTCGEGSEISLTKEFMRIKNGPFSVRVRKLDAPGQFESLKLPKSAEKQRADGLLEALRKVQPFMSEDASRPWSVAVKIESGFVWATNNLALVRSPLKIKALEGAIIPAAAVDFICSLPELGHFDIDDKKRIILTSGRALLRFPQAQAQWPDLSKFFEAMPKSLPPVPEDMREAALRVGKFSDRSMALSGDLLSGKSEMVEAEYEVDLKKGKGIYSAKLLNLILSNSKEADFSLYPKPIFFRGPLLEGTAVGMKESEA